MLATGRQLVPDDLDGIVSRYPAISIPTLLLWGRADRVVPLRVGQRLARELSDARLVILEDCGHLPPEERPEDSLGAVRGFIETLDG